MVKTSRLVWRAATAGAVIVGLGLVPMPVAAATSAYVRTVSRFDAAAGQNPENLAVAPDGTVFLTWLFAHTVAAVRPDGSLTTVVLPAGLTSGVAIDPLRPNRLAVGVISSDPAVSGIWSVPFGAFDGRARPTRQVPLPADAFPNGITFASDGTMFIADSTRGLILRVAAESRTATTWLNGTVLTPTGETFDGVALPGANGVKVFGRDLYVTNTARRLLLRIPILAASAGNPVTVASGYAFDDFIVDSSGVVTAAINIDDEVIRLAPGHRPEVLVGGLENPSAIAHGRSGELLVTDAAYFGTHPALLAIVTRGLGR